MVMVVVTVTFQLKIFFFHLRATDVIGTRFPLGSCCQLIGQIDPQWSPTHPTTFKYFSPFHLLFALFFLWLVTQLLCCDKWPVTYEFWCECDTKLILNITIYVLFYMFDACSSVSCVFWNHCLEHDKCFSVCVCVCVCLCHRIDKWSIDLSFFPFSILWWWSGCQLGSKCD